MSKSVYVRVSDKEYDELIRLAKMLGYWRGNKPHIGGLIKDIANGKIILALPLDNTK